MKIIFFLFCIFNFTITFGQDKNFETLKLNLPKSNLEAKNVTFNKNEILLEGKKCFNYSLFHNYEVDGKIITNYYEIKSLDNQLVFTGEIFKNDNGQFIDLITFHNLNKSLYKNAKVVGRNSLILNLSSNQVLNKDCSLNSNNLKLFFDLSNENQNQIK